MYVVTQSGEKLRLQGEDAYLGGQPKPGNGDVLCYFSINGKARFSPSLSLTTPSPTDSTYDTIPSAAIYIAAPASATTRNFNSGIWVETNGSATDKGRGIAVHNIGASDSIYLQQDGPGGTGLASLLTTSATGSAYGIVVGTTLNDHVGVTIRQETALLGSAACATLLSVEANGSVTEMVRINSTVNSQSGIVFRLSGTSANAFSVLGTADALLAQMTAAGVLTVAGLTGTTTNNNANAGSVGEYNESVIPSASEVTLTSGVDANVTSLSLTAGDWDVWGLVYFDLAGTTTISNAFAWISTTSATLPSLDLGTRSTYCVIGSAGIPTATPYLEAPKQRFSLSGTTTVYLSTRCSFGVSTAKAFGALRARRRR